jgi:micrococcal nuclease
LPIPPDLEIVQVANVIDGDTIELSDGRRVRYIGLNTPEQGQPFYEEAKAANERLVSGLRVGLERDLESFDQYGRLLAYVWVNKQMVNLELLHLGFGNTFTIPPNVRYEAEFRAAEQAARAAERGLWASSTTSLKIIDLQANAPGSDRDNPNGEWLEIANQGSQAINLQGYTLKDEANHIYTFGRFTLKPGAMFRLYSGEGRNTNSTLYWGLAGDSVWNNDTDTAYLRDAAGALVDIYVY